MLCFSDSAGADEGGEGLARKKAGISMPHLENAHARCASKMCQLGE
jgi:hypothetical protein